MSRLVIGILANSDGRSDAVAAAIDVFLASGAEVLIHCGDVGGRHVLDAMSAFGTSMFVWGDRDKDRMGLMRYAHSRHVNCFGVLGEFEVSDKKLVIVHGDDKRLLKKIADEQQYDYLLCGHEMSAEDRTSGKTRIVNPGPLHGGAGRSAALLDPATGKLRLVSI
jgi:putative phosphoesterase